MSIPRLELSADDRLWIRLWLAAPMKTPTSKRRTEPPRIVTPACRAALSTPTSQDSPSGHDATGAPSPPTVCPFKSSVMLSAPITIPLLGQSVRSLVSFVSLVIVMPQLTWLATAGPLPETHKANTVSTTHNAPPRSKRWDLVLCTCLFIATPSARVEPHRPRYVREHSHDRERTSAMARALPRSRSCESRAPPGLRCRWCRRSP